MYALSLENKVYPLWGFSPAAIRKLLAKEVYDSFNSPLCSNL